MLEFRGITTIGVLKMRCAEVQELAEINADFLEQGFIVAEIVDADGTWREAVFYQKAVFGFIDGHAPEQKPALTPENSTLLFPARDILKN